MPCYIYHYPYEYEGENSLVGYYKVDFDDNNNITKVKPYYKSDNLDKTCKTLNERIYDFKDTKEKKEC